MSPQELAAALGGDVQGNGALVPGPGHSAKDRSLSVRLDPNAREGFLVHSFAGDDWRTCRDHVRAKLGWPCGTGASERWIRGRPKPPRDDTQRVEDALLIWQEAGCAMSIVRTYLRSRGIDLPNDIAGRVIRQHPRHGMVCLFRDIRTDDPCAIHRVFLTSEGLKIGPAMKGPTKGAAIKLDADEDVTDGLFVGEGVETCLSARQLGLKPTWALGSAGGIERFPVIGGIESLNILKEYGKDGKPCPRNTIAIRECGARWLAAGREVFVVDPKKGDMNDVLLRKVRAA